MTRLSAWARWQAAAGPWRGWVVCPALTMPAAPRATSSTAQHCADLADVLTGGGSAVLLDVEPTLGVRSAAEANRRGLAHVVLVLPRWPHADAVLPSAELLGVLMASAVQLRPVRTSSVVFVLDGERQRSIERAATDGRIDNRYALAPSELPNLARLRAAGIQRVVKVVASR